MFCRDFSNTFLCCKSLNGVSNTELICYFIVLSTGELRDCVKNVTNLPRDRERERSEIKHDSTQNEHKVNPNDCFTPESVTVK